MRAKIYNRREAIKIIEKNGWKLDRTHGSHYIFKHPENAKILSVAETLNPMIWRRLIKEYDINLHV